MTDGVHRVQHWLRGNVVFEYFGDSIVLDGVVELELLGKEIVWNHRPSCMGCGRTDKSRVVFEDGRKLRVFRHERVKQNFKFLYPFAIFLPLKLPPSMEYDKGSCGDGCSVSYRLRVRFGDIVQSDREVQIIGPCAIKPHPYTLLPTCLSPRSPDIAMSTDCLVLAAKLENSYVGRGDILDLSLACRNLSRATIKRVDVQLEEDISWTPLSYSALPQRRSHVEKIILSVMKNVELDSLLTKAPESHEGWTWKDSKHGNVEVNSMRHAEIHADLVAQRNHIHLEVPTTARDSTENTAWISVRHTLRIILVTNGQSRDPQVAIPVRILGPSKALSVQQHGAHNNKLSTDQIIEAATAVWPQEPCRPTMVPFLKPVTIQESSPALIE